ncbi:cytochrome P450 [Gigaspora rosea]|uniref:Cytochrome P450 n=1 Tax=Gigaspora rosea TaxID=44941 RepID=A0A397TTJ4_9GLOM|nr:cytochrome P450 [Gigaspora rosea]
MTPKHFSKNYGELFSLYIFGGVVTFAGADSIPEVLNNTTAFSFGRGVNKQTTPIDDIVIPFFRNNKPPRINQLAREMSSKANSNNVSKIQKELLFIIENFFGNCEEPKVFSNIHDTIVQIMAKLTINLALGQECAQFEDLVSIFAELATITLRMKFVPPILSFIHPSVHKYFVSLPLKNAIDRHKNIFIQRCKPIVEERILQRKKLGEKYIRKDDIFDYFINELQLDFVDDKFMDYFYVHVYLLIYASNNTTTKFFASTFYDYCGRPELWKELYEEQLKIHNESNGNLGIDDVDKMVKLDCFVKESFRHSADIASLPHIVNADSYTFSNGATIPKDRDVFLYMQDINFNNKFYGETSDDFQPKRGKHACPGRVYAVNVIKILLHEAILKYKIRTESGKIELPKIISCFSTSSESSLIFENRN